jgi:hypothetical protein
MTWRVGGRIVRMVVVVGGLTDGRRAGAMLVRLPSFPAD